MWSCGNDKSPGPDGFNFRFIKHFWQELKPDFLRFLDEFFVNASFPKGSNSSFIALIPKVKEPQAINDFRPISLIGCTYKIIAKLLANGLRKVMSYLVDERQTTFIKGRQLLHGVVHFCCCLPQLCTVAAPFLLLWNSNWCQSKKKGGLGSNYKEV